MSISPYFTVVDEVPGRVRCRSSDSTAGPWAPHLQHGGPPGALLCRSAERLAAAHTGRSDLLAVRLSAEFVGPVPVGDVEVSAEVLRAARSAVLVSVVLSADERPCLQGRVWLVGRSDTTSVAAAPDVVAEPPGGLAAVTATFPYGTTVDWRPVAGGFDAPGPGDVWARPLTTLVAGEALSGLQRVVLVGDSVSGLSAELDWDEWSFVNVDLDVHLVRPVDGDWIRFDARSTLGPTGVGLARSTVSDRRGEVGATAQTLLLAPRRRE